MATELEGAYIIEVVHMCDERGSFARTFCACEFQEHGLNANMVQSNLSVSRRRHTLRGLHYQADEACEAKLVRCARGAVQDVIVDLRRKSATFGRHFMVELSEWNNRMLYVPPGFAHGFVTLTDDCHIFYQVSNYYCPEKERGVRWNDPVFGIEWPVDSPSMSEKDANWPDFVL